MTVEEVTKHAQQYSKSYSSKNSVWATDFDAMALKTCLRLLLSKYGIMSVEMQRAYIEDSTDTVYLADEAIEDNEEAFETEVIEAEATELSEEVSDPKI
jgi:recombination protein RecT